MQTWIWIFRFLCLGLSLLAAFLLYRALLHDRSRGRRRCPRCWYDLAGAPGLTCPECGKQPRHERALFRTRRHWRTASAALLIVALAYFAGLAPKAIRSGSWWSAVPTPILVVVLQFYDDDDAQLFNTMRARLSGAGNPLSAWERLLLARRCGKILLEPLVNIPPSAPPAFRFAATQPPGDQPLVAADLSNAPTPVTTQGLPAAARDLLMQADAAYDAKRLSEAQEKYQRLRDEFQSTMTSDQAVYVATRLLDIRLVLDDQGAQVTTAAPTALAGIPILSNFFGTTLQAQALDVLNSLGPDARAALPSLIACIDDNASPHRYAAIRLVGRIGPQARSTVPALARQLANPSSVDPVLGALLKLDRAAAAAAPQLRQLLKGDHTVERTLVIVRILQRTMPIPELVDLLRQKMLTGRYPPISAARGLELIGPPAASTIPDLVHVAARYPESMGTSAIQIIASFGPTSTPTLIEFLQTGNVYQQAAAACWLGHLGPHAAAAAPPLISALASPDPNVRAQSAFALGHIGATSAAPDLVRLSTTDPIPWVRETAAESLARLNAAQTDRP